ncbi:hypothetical protein [Bdellovibrio sp. HCB288]|uniref:hypothetical protein n=1 Tax=Bdellovibrio sp. HCB288 TaxID=3394355 RepID=UPI0039B43A3F
MEPKFTKGWIVEENFGLEGLAFLTIRDEKETLCSTWLNPDRKLANLLSAAPDLYEALEQMLKDWDDHIQLPVKTVMDAKAALKKARGES